MLWDLQLNKYMSFFRINICHLKKSMSISRESSNTPQLFKKKKKPLQNVLRLILKGK